MRFSRRFGALEKTVVGAGGGGKREIARIANFDANGADDGPTVRDGRVFRR